jgi:RNA-splicing ligase RtcB
MPDVHPAEVYPNGIVVKTKNNFYKELIGGDIGCGITLFNLGKPNDNFIEKLNKISTKDI